MAATTDNRKYAGDGANLDRGGIGLGWNGPVKASAVLKVGALAGQLFSDTANPPAIDDYVADGTMRCLGFVTLGADNTGGALGARPTRVLSETGSLVDKNAGGGSAIGPADAYKPAYGVDNQTVSKLATDGPCIGMLTGVIDKVTGQPVVLVDPVFAALMTGRGLAAGAASPFVSTEQTGTGSAQNIAHGLGATPSKVVIVPTDTNPATTGAYTATEGAHTATNVIVTVTTGKKYKVMAWL
jgi:hypothetical protein